jgi:hypothetical protein
MGQDLQTFSADFWREQSRSVATTEPLGVMPSLTVRAGQMLYEGEPVVGNQALAIIIDSLRVNTYFDGPYDPDVPQAPRCYAISRDGESMGPHPTMQDALHYFQPQSALCQGCPKNEWGSSTTGNRKGKACQNRRRLYMLAAGRLEADGQWKVFDQAKYYTAADIVQMSLPVTSVRAWSDYVHKLASTVQRPPFGVATRISVSPHPKHQFHINFDLFAVLPDELAGPIVARRNALLSQPIQGFAPPSDQAAPF